MSGDSAETGRTKKCTGCFKVLPVDFFYVKKRTGYLYSKCRDCCLADSKAYFKTEHGRAKAKEINQRTKERHHDLVMFWTIKAAAKKMGRDFSISVEDLLPIPSHCPVLGIPLFWTRGRRTDNTPSVDRIDSLRGYVPGNVVVVSWRANKLKQDATLEELGKIWNFYRNLA